MPTDVVMPQMGESIAEGTIVRWIKKVGDQVARDEPLFEISTDKVDAEIPSPAAGVVAEIRVKEGETVPVNSVVAVIGQAGDPAAKAVEAPADHLPGAAASSARSEPATAPSAQADATGPVTQRFEPPEAAASPEATVERGDQLPPEMGAPVTRGPEALEDRLRQRSSPLVRKIAKDHEVDISQIRGTGIAGRVTKRDILDFIAQADAPRSAGLDVSSPVPPPAPQPGPESRPTPGPPRGSAAPGQVQPMSVMRKKIAEHMIDEPADVGPRALGVRGELHARGADSTGEEGRVRAGGREAHLSLVHHQGGRRRAAGGADRQRIDRRRQHRVPLRRQSRHRRRARLGPDRPGDQEGRRAQPARAEPGGGGPGGPRARAVSSNRTK